MMYRNVKKSERYIVIDRGMFLSKCPAKRCLAKKEGKKEEEGKNKEVTDRKTTTTCVHETVACQVKNQAKVKQNS